MVSLFRSSKGSKNRHKFLQAIKARNVDAVYRCLQNDPNGDLVNLCTTRNQETALMMASEVGDEALVHTLLLSKRANPLLKNIHGETALDKARLKGHAEIVKLLQHAQAQQQQHPQTIDVIAPTDMAAGLVFRTDHFAQHYRVRVPHAVKAGQQFAAIVIEPVNQDTSRTTENRPLDASQNDRNDAEENNDDNRPVLSISYLSPQEANAMEDREKPDVDVRSPLMRAIQEGHLAKVKKLVNLVAIQETQSREYPEIHCAAVHGHVPILQWLLSKGAPIDLRNRYGETPLMLACRDGQEAVVRFLLNLQARMDIVTSSTGKTALHYASQKGNLSIANLLVEKAQTLANLYALQWINAQTFTGGYSALMLASLAGHERTVQFLLSRGADAFAQTAGALPRNALSMAREKGHMAIVQMLQKHMDHIPRQAFGATTFSRAVEKNQVSHVVECLRQGVDADIRDGDDWTALLLSVYLLHWEMAQVLLEAGANPNACTPGGETALVLACQVGNRNTARALIRYGANLREQGHEALRVAKENGHRRIVTLLQSYDADYPKHNEEAAEKEREQRKRLWLVGQPSYRQTNDEPRPILQSQRETETVYAPENEEKDTVHSVLVETISHCDDSESEAYQPEPDACWLFPVQEQSAMQKQASEELEQLSSTSETHEETHSAIDDDLITEPDEANNRTQFYEDGFDC